MSMCLFLDSSHVTDTGFRESIHFPMLYKIVVCAFFSPRRGSLLFSDDPWFNQGERQLLFLALSENQCQWMSVNLRPTVTFLPSTTKLRAFSPLIVVFVCCLRNSKNPVTGPSLAAQMNNKCKWMNPECYPLISQLAGVSLWSFLCRAIWKLLLNSFLLSFLLDKKLLYILFSREHIILSKLHRKRGIFKMSIT